MSKNQTWLALWLCIVLMFTVESGVHSPIPEIPKAYAVTRNIVLDGRIPGWNSTTSNPNPAITVTEGDTVNVALSSGDGAPHQFYVNIDGQPGANCPPSGTDKCSAFIPPSTTYTFAVDFPTGVYTYFCSVHPNSMHGSFTVQSGFTITASPSTLSIAQGSSGMTTVTLTSMNGFSGTANLVGTVSPAGPMPTLSPNPVTLPAGGTASSTLTVSTSSSTPTGTYTVQVDATINGVTHMTIVMVNVLGRDFTINASPATLRIPAGSGGTSTITLQSFNGFSGSITLTAVSSPNVLGESFSVTPVSLAAGATATSMLTVSAPFGTAAGNYTVTVTGTNQSLTRSTTVSVSVLDFSMAASSTSLTIQQGSTGTSTVTLLSLNGFSGDVVLDASSSSSTLSPSLSVRTVSLAARGSGSSTVTISTGGLYPASPGTYNVNVTGSSGRIEHSFKITVTVSSSGLGTSSLAILVGIAVVAIVVVAGVLYLALRKRSKKQT